MSKFSEALPHQFASFKPIQTAKTDNWFLLYDSINLRHEVESNNRINGFANYHFDRCQRKLIEGKLQDNETD